MVDADECPRPLTQADAAALIGILANLELLVMTRGISGDELGLLLDRAQADGYAAPGDGEHELRQALNDLNQRVRFALGEYDSLPAPSPVPVVD
ncbi:hypothetical protein [Microterricola viridarii]|uniref:Uncharacterized protein n=1 Tax=Microterricola viridarii TaxID=412690 RepID=A0A1H1NHJ6_9MICO|nr:hypothetical protein [Microterricola viridarii]SDR98310.1 hypothetical protein SAMN04489834_0641 [Microterricola viridarii]